MAAALADGSKPGGWLWGGGSPQPADAGLGPGRQLGGALPSGLSAVPGVQAAAAFGTGAVAAAAKPWWLHPCPRKKEQDGRGEGHMMPLRGIPIGSLQAPAPAVPLPPAPAVPQPPAPAVPQPPRAQLHAAVMDPAAAQQLPDLPATRSLEEAFDALLDLVEQVGWGLLGVNCLQGHLQLPGPPGAPASD